MSDKHKSGGADAARAVRFLAIKAAIFILVPLIAAIITVLMVL
ncbi:MAG: phosphoribosylformylglycinamidine synthase [Alphaproteobacteria bacterium]|nr:phosphoribosylformylglycinamidine synthase [Alphaproteobacteria bacterium]